MGKTDEIIIKDLRGKSSEEDQLFLLEFLRASPANKIYFNKVKLILLVR